MLDLPITTLSNSSHHVRCSTSDDEVEEPLSRSRDSDVEGSKTSGRDLRHVDPAHRAPSKLEEAGEEEDTNESEVSSAWHGLTLDRWVDAHVETDVEHGGTLGDGSPEKRTTTTEGVSSKDQEAEAADHLDDTVDSSGKELVLVTDETESPEDLRSVVVDSVGTGHLLANHQADGDESALSVSGDGEHLPQEILDGGTSDKHAFVLELIGDILDLILDVRVGFRKTSDTCKYFGSFLPAILLSEITWGLLVESHADNEEYSGKGLESKRNNIDPGAAAEVHERSIVDPEGETGSSCDEELVETSKTTTNTTGSVFRDIERDNHGSTTDTDTSNETRVESDIVLGILVVKSTYRPMYIASM